MPRKRADAPDVKTPLVLEGEAKRATMEIICHQIADGTPLRQICRQPGMPSWRTVYDWINSDANFAASMENARKLGARAIAEETLHIADTPQIGSRRERSSDGYKIVREDMLGHRKLQIETRLKLLAKWHPEEYGEKVQHSGKIQLTDMTDAELDAKLAALESMAVAGTTTATKADE